MSEVSLQHGMARQMAASQSMQAGMQILQASALELKQLLRHALETNPMLEELPDASPEALEDGPDGDAWNEREDGWNEFTPEGRPSAEAAARRDFMYESVVAPESLKTHLTDQAQHSALTGRARDALFLLIDALDDRGFLTESPQELEERECFSMRDMEEALDVLRGMDPPGVGAADLRDSLLIQLEQRGLKRSLAFRLVKRCWRELAAHKYEEAARLLDTLLSSCAADERLSESACSQMLHRLLCLLLLDENDPAQDRSDRIAQAIRYMNRHLFEPLTVQGVAEAVNLSASHFSREFKARTGYSPYEYIVLRRIDKAKYLLTSTRQSVKEVAYATGYNSEENFIHSFQKHVGIPPGLFRKYPV